MRHGVRACVGAHVMCVRVCANGHAAPGRVLVRGRTARVGRWTSTLKHTSVGFSSPIRVHVHVSCSLCSSTCMHKTRKIRPIAGLAGGWILTTRIVRCVLSARINLPRPRNLPRRRPSLSSRAEGRQKPKSAPDNAPFWLRWPVPGTLDTLNIHS